MDHAELQAEIPVVLGAWGIGANSSVSAVPGGTLNFNFDVRADGGRYFLRCYRSNLETERIAGEHALVEWVAERDVPAATAIRTADGGTVVEVEGRRWALFPWMPGRPIPRGELPPAAARSLGEVHGRIQAVLAEHPESRAARMAMRWDRAQSLVALEHVISIAEQGREPDWLLGGLKRQRHMLEEMDVWTPDRFASLPCQLLHGDFHDQQALFVDDEVSAIVDWEIWHMDPRAWELVRSLSFSTLLASPRLEDYLAGYREHVRLTEDEVVLALRLWFQSRVVGLWAWWAYFVEGNERVKDFFPAMIAELDRVADEGWRETLTARVIHAAVKG
ncbi:MAG TPA: phosphotransferase [Tepidiformaceae bacterium]|nr:phosphotransferase [Tepidiformaceae bacterium]